MEHRACLPLGCLGTGVEVRSLSEDRRAQDRLFPTGLPCFGCCPPLPYLVAANLA
jgi:hypothetical protein